MDVADFIFCPMLSNTQYRQYGELEKFRQAE